MFSLDVRTHTNDSLGNFLPVTPNNESPRHSMRVDPYKPISYFYPLLIKSRVLVYDDIPENTNCSLENCKYCNNHDICQKCKTGYYLHNNQCITRCPKSFYTDTLTYTCKDIKHDPNYLMKYSKGSCQNMCGNWSNDCSCASDCKYTGTCCTDYKLHNCDRIIY
jgi:hypothetical protein